MSVSFLSMRIAVRGAWPALAKTFITSPTLRDFGSTMWNAWPSRPSRWAMWSIAAATKSTGTMFVSPHSIDTSGTHSGSAWRTFWSGLKK